MKRLLTRGWPWLLVATSVVAAALVVGRSVSGPPLDPRSTAPDGARAVVDVLSELGRPVRVGSSPDAGDDTVLVLVDRLSVDDRERVRDHLEGGGRVVVADPLSLLADADVTGRLPSDIVGPSSFAPACDDPELADVAHVRSSVWWMFEPDPGDRTCFPVGDGVWLLRRAVGDGELVLLGGADPFTNARLDEADNALLLVRVLGEDGQVLVTEASPPGGGDATLAELVPDRVYLALGLLVLAFVLAAWAAGRRLGLPADEPLPVRIPASELVVATGQLMQRAGLRAGAAGALRDELRRDATTRLGLPEDVPTAALAARVAVWTGADPTAVERLLEGPVPADDADLVSLAHTIGRLRAGLHAGTTTTTLTSGTPAGRTRPEERV